MVYCIGFTTLSPRFGGPPNGRTYVGHVGGCYWWTTCESRNFNMLEENYWNYTSLDVFNVVQYISINPAGFQELPKP